MKSIKRLLYNLLSSRRSKFLRTSIMRMFVPLIALSVIITGTFSYFIAYRQIEENAYVSLADTVSQSKILLDSKLSDIFEQMLYVKNVVEPIYLSLKYSEATMKPQYYITAESSLSQVYSNYYSMIDSILMYFNDGLFTLQKRDYITEDINFSFNEWRGKYNNKEGDFYWVNLHADEIFKYHRNKNRVVSIFNLIGDTDSQLRGIILFNLRESFFSNILENVEISENGYLTLISEDGVMSFKNVEEKYTLDESDLEFLVKAEDDSGTQKFSNSYGTKMMAVYDTLDTNGWKLVAVFPENELTQTISFIKYATAIIMVILLLVSVVLSNMLARIVTKPLSQLTKKVHKVEEGNLDVIFDVYMDNEIGILGKGITKMIERVKELLDQVEFEHNRKRKAEFAALQAQIKPHFLYNTLYAIKQLCKMNEMEDAEIMVSALATFFRISVSKGEEVITVKEEISHVENYLIIQHMRYKDRLKYSINISEDLYCYSAVKLMLQPIVENAIYHGINNKRGSGIINITGYLEGEDLVFTVHDDGIGISSEKLEEIKNLLQNKERNADDSLGMGLLNVHERIRIMFGQRYGIEIESIFQEGTTVHLKIPAIKPLKQGGIRIA